MMKFVRSKSICSEDSSDGEKEHAVVTVKAAVMVYDDSKKQWIPKGVSKVQIWHHATNETYRIVGRKLQDTEVVINCGIPKGLKYNEATPTFHQWRDSREVYGLNFNSKEEAGNFSQAMTTALDSLNSGLRYAAPPGPPNVQQYSSQPSAATGMYQQPNVHMQQQPPQQQQQQQQQHPQAGGMPANGMDSIDRRLRGAAGSDHYEELGDYHKTAPPGMYRQAQQQQQQQQPGMVMGNRNNNNLMSGSDASRDRQQRPGIPDSMLRTDMGPQSTMQQQQPSYHQPAAPVQAAPGPPPVAPAPPMAPAPPVAPAPPAAPPAAPTPPAPPAAPPAPLAAPAAPPAPPPPPAGGAGPPPPPPPPPAPPAGGPAGGGAGGLAAALAAGASTLKKAQPKEETSSQSSTNGSGGGGGGGGGFLAEMQGIFAKRKALSVTSTEAPAEEKKPVGGGGGGGVGGARASPGMHRRVNNSPAPGKLASIPASSGAANSNATSAPSGGGGIPKGDLEQFKQEMLAEFRKELQDFKAELMDSIRREMSK